MSTFNSVEEILAYIENACANAVNATCNELFEVLTEKIGSEYYAQYTPYVYIRTMQFLSAATKKMIDPLCGMIYMDSGSMSYKNWSGAQQIQMAAQGFHGGFSIQTGGRYWDTFVEYCNQNAVNILRKNLQAQGIPV